MNTEYTTGAVRQMQQSDGRIKPHLVFPRAELLFEIEVWLISDSRRSSVQAHYTQGSEPVPSCFVSLRLFEASRTFS